MTVKMDNIILIKEKNGRKHMMTMSLSSWSNPGNVKMKKAVKLLKRAGWREAEKDIEHEITTSRGSLTIEPAVKKTRKRSEMNAENTEAANE